MRHGDKANGQRMNHWYSEVENLHINLWSITYEGIFKVNNIIANFDRVAVQYETEAAKNQALGEAYFLRAFFYFRLAKCFKTVPLMLLPDENPNKPKASVDELYAQIFSDFKWCIDNMPRTTFNQLDESRLGHATVWAAEAMMARVWLFYTGFFNKTEGPLVEDGSITEGQVLALLEDIIDNSGHVLVTDPRELWPYSYDDEYWLTKENNLEWVGDGKGNSEAIFVYKYGWGAPWPDVRNYIVLSGGFRKKIGNWGTGFYWSPVHKSLWDCFEPGDVRQAGSIIDVYGPNLVKEGFPADTTWNLADDMGRDDMETGYTAKKYLQIIVTNANGKRIPMYSEILGNEDTGNAINWQDEQLVRLADVMLMACELNSPKSQTYFDAIRTRAGLPAGKAPTLENIKHERRVELCFEGVRRQDLMRWGDFEEARKALDGQIFYPDGRHNGAKQYIDNYRPENEGFIHISESQIKLSNGILEQNAGWPYTSIPATYR